MVTGILDRIRHGFQAADLLKIGPKGYIHGWIFVGVPGVGLHVFHPKHGAGRVSHHDEHGHVHVAFDSGKIRSFAHTGAAGGSGTLGRRKDVGGNDAFTTHLNAASAAARRKDYTASAEHYRHAADAATHPKIREDMLVRAKRDDARGAVASPKNPGLDLGGATEGSEYGRVQRHFREFTPEQMAQRRVSPRIPYENRRDVGEHVYTHPDLPGQEFKTQRDAAATGFRHRLAEAESTARPPRKTVPKPPDVERPKPVEPVTPQSGHAEHLAAADAALAAGDRAKAINHLMVAARHAPTPAEAQHARDRHTVLAAEEMGVPVPKDVERRLAGGGPTYVAPRPTGTAARPTTHVGHLRAAEDADIEAAKELERRNKLDADIRNGRAGSDRPRRGNEVLGSVGTALGRLRGHDETIAAHRRKAEQHRSAAAQVLTAGATPEDRASKAELKGMAAQALAAGDHERAAQLYERVAARSREGDTGWTLERGSKGWHFSGGEKKTQYSETFGSRKAAEDWRTLAAEGQAQDAEFKAAEARRAAAKAATPPQAAALDFFTPHEQAVIRNAVTDHAGRYGNTPGIGTTSAARYVAEGPLKDLTNEHGLAPVWEGAQSVIRENPDVALHDDATRAANTATRHARAEGISQEINTAFDAGNHARVDALLDEGQALDPKYRPGQTKTNPGLSWQEMRDLVAEERAKPSEVVPTVNTVDASTTLDGLPPTTEIDAHHAAAEQALTEGRFVEAYDHTIAADRAYHPWARPQHTNPTPEGFARSRELNARSDDLYRRAVAGVPPVEAPGGPVERTRYSQLKPGDVIRMEHAKTGAYLQSAHTDQGPTIPVRVDHVSHDGDRVGLRTSHGTLSGGENWLVYRHTAQAAARPAAEPGFVDRVKDAVTPQDRGGSGAYNHVHAAIRNRTARMERGDVTLGRGQAAAKDLSDRDIQDALMHGRRFTTAGPEHSNTKEALRAEARDRGIPLVRAKETPSAKLSRNPQTRALQIAHSDLLPLAVRDGDTSGRYNEALGERLRALPDDQVKALDEHARSIRVPAMGGLVDQHTELRHALGHEASRRRVAAREVARVETERLKPPEPPAPDITPPPAPPARVIAAYATPNEGGGHNPVLGAHKPPEWVHDAPNLDLPPVDRNAPKSNQGIHISPGDIVSVGQRGERTYAGQDNRAVWSVLNVHPDRGTVRVVSHGSPNADGWSYDKTWGTAKRRAAIQKEWPISGLHHEESVTDQEYRRVENLGTRSKDDKIHQEFMSHSALVRETLTARANEVSKELRPGAANAAWKHTLDEHNRNEMIRHALRTVPGANKYQVTHTYDDNGDEVYRFKPREKGNYSTRPFTVIPITRKEDHGVYDSKARQWTTFASNENGGQSKRYAHAVPFAEAVNAAIDNDHTKTQSNPLSDMSRLRRRDRDAPVPTLEPFTSAKTPLSAEATRVPGPTPEPGFVDRVKDIDAEYARQIQRDADNMANSAAGNAAATAERDPQRAVYDRHLDNYRAALQAGNHAEAARHLDVAAPLAPDEATRTRLVQARDRLAARETVPEAKPEPGFVDRVKDADLPTSVRSQPEVNHDRIRRLSGPDLEREYGVEDRRDVHSPISVALREERTRRALERDAATRARRAARTATGKPSVVSPTVKPVEAVTPKPAGRKADTQAVRDKLTAAPAAYAKEIAGNKTLESGGGGDFAVYKKPRAGWDVALATDGRRANSHSFDTKDQAHVYADSLKNLQHEGGAPVNWSAPDATTPTVRNGRSEGFVQAARRAEAEAHGGQHLADMQESDTRRAASTAREDRMRALGYTEQVAAYDVQPGDEIAYQHAADLKDAPDIVRGRVADHDRHGAIRVTSGSRTSDVGEIKELAAGSPAYGSYGVATAPSGGYGYPRIYRRPRREGFQDPAAHVGDTYEVRHGKRNASYSGHNVVRVEPDGRESTVHNTAGTEAHAKAVAAQMRRELKTGTPEGGRELPDREHNALHALAARPLTSTGYTSGQGSSTQAIDTRDLPKPVLDSLSSSGHIGQFASQPMATITGRGRAYLAGNAADAATRDAAARLNAAHDARTVADAQRKADREAKAKAQAEADKVKADARRAKDAARAEADRQRTIAKPAAGRRRLAGEAQRGDLIVTEHTRRDFVAGQPAAESKEYKVHRVASVDRNGMATSGHDLAWSGDSAPHLTTDKNGILRTGASPVERRWIVPKETVDAVGVQNALRAHTYPGSTTPMPYDDLKAVTALIEPHTTGAGATARAIPVSDDAAYEKASKRIRAAGDITAQRRQLDTELARADLPAGARARLEDIKAQDVARQAARAASDPAQQRAERAKAEVDETNRVMATPVDRTPDGMQRLADGLGLTVRTVGTGEQMHSQFFTSSPGVYGTPQKVASYQARNDKWSSANGSPVTQEQALTHMGEWAKNPKGDVLHTQYEADRKFRTARGADVADRELSDAVARSSRLWAELQARQNKPGQ